MRKPTQILFDGVHLIALCDDGTIWRSTEAFGCWAKLPEVREPTAKEEAALIERMNWLTAGTQTKAINQ